MENLIKVLLLLLLPFASQGQSLRWFATVQPRDTDTAITLNQLKMPWYSTEDSNKVLGVDENGLVVLRTKGTGGGGSETLQQVISNGNVLTKDDTIVVDGNSFWWEEVDQMYILNGGGEAFRFDAFEGYLYIYGDTVATRPYVRSLIPLQGIANQDDTTQIADFKINGTGQVGDLIVESTIPPTVRLENTNTTTGDGPFMTMEVTGQNPSLIQYVPKDQTNTLPWRRGARGTGLNMQSPGNLYYVTLGIAGAENADHVFYVNQGAPAYDSLVRFDHNGDVYVYHKPTLGTGDTVLKRRWDGKLQETVVTGGGSGIQWTDTAYFNKMTTRFQSDSNYVSQAAFDDASNSVRLKNKAGENLDVIYLTGFADSLGLDTAKTAIRAEIAAGESVNFRTIYFKEYFEDTSGFAATGFTPSTTGKAIRLTSGSATFTQYMTLDGSVNTDENFTIDAIYKVTATGAGIAIGKKSINTWYYPSLVATFNTSTGVMGFYNPTTNTLIGSKTGVVTCNVNDIVRLKYYQVATVVNVVVENLTQFTYDNFTITGNLGASKNFELPNAGSIAIYNLGGTNDLLSLKVTSAVPYQPHVVFIGDSKTHGYSANSQWLRFSACFPSGYSFGGDGDRTVETVVAIPYVSRLRPQYAVVCIGRNDLASGVASGTWQANYTAIVDSLENVGTTVIHLLPIPEAGFDQSSLNAWINATYPSALKIDPSVGWNAGTMESSDGVHPNELGHRYIANLIKASGYISDDTNAVNNYYDWLLKPVANSVSVNTANYVTKSDGSAFANSVLYESTNAVGVNTSAPVNYGAGLFNFQVEGSSYGVYSFGKTGSGNHYFSSDGSSMFWAKRAAGGSLTDLLWCTPTNGWQINPDFVDKPSAAFTINSTSKGFLPPRMTADQAGNIVSPAEGLMLYVTDTNVVFTSKGWWGWNGAAWEKLNN